MGLYYTNNTSGPAAVATPITNSRPTTCKLGQSADRVFAFQQLTRRPQRLFQRLRADVHHRSGGRSKHADRRLRQRHAVDSAASRHHGQRHADAAGDGFPGADALIAQPPTPGNAHGDCVQFLINGRPFNGTGFGFNPSTTSHLVGLVDANDGRSATTTTARHRPNMYPVRPAAQSGFLQPTANNLLYTSPAASAEPTRITTRPIGTTCCWACRCDPRDVGNHRSPTLASSRIPRCTGRSWCSYWMPRGRRLSSWSESSATLAAADHAAADRTAVAHPAHQRHRCPTIRISPAAIPTHNGFDPINGPWDVDNDGDGIADSVWVDLGLPVQTAPDGTTYKPLFAIRVLDMDGRLNVNAHGNSAQTEATYASRPRQ